MTDYSALSEDIYSVKLVDKHILLVTLNRPKYANSVPSRYHAKLDAIWTKFENDPQLRVAIITGKGRFFCAGADLKEWLETANRTSRPPSENSEGSDRLVKYGGFLGISNRETTKPIIAAVNGSSYGGGTEALINCDLAVAVSSATISLPESRRGVIALAGALPRIGRQLGLKRASELALVSEPISAHTAHQWGLLNRVVDNPDELLPVAFDLAKKISLGSPEAIAASLRGVRRGYSDTKHTLAEATGVAAEEEGRLVHESENIKEGLAAFNQKRNPSWRL